MASRNQTRLDEQNEVDLEEELENLEQLIERCKVLYEQHFMGIQKMPPSTLHRQAERRMIKLTQLKMRNTAQRFRFTTLSQKFGAYNTYWRRTMRAIEQGRYIPHLAAAARRSNRDGKAMPDELLQKMPKRLREKLLRDRAKLEERADREEARRDAAGGGASASKVRTARSHQHTVDDAGGDEFDFDAMFDAIQTDDKGRPATADPPAKPAAASAKPAASDFDLDASFDAIMSDDVKPAAPAAKPTAPAPKPARSAAAKPAAPAARRPASAPAAAAPRATARPAATGGARRDSQGNALPPGMSEHQTRDLFDKYVKARKLVGERVDNVSYAKLMSTLNKQAPTIMKQHNASAVEFNVVIKDDRVVLKAKPKK